MCSRFYHQNPFHHLPWNLIVPSFLKNTLLSKMPNNVIAPQVFSWGAEVIHWYLETN